MCLPPLFVCLPFRLTVCLGNGFAKNLQAVFAVVLWCARDPSVQVLPALPLTTAKTAPLSCLCSGHKAVFAVRLQKLLFRSSFCSLIAKTASQHCFGKFFVEKMENHQVVSHGQGPGSKKSLRNLTGNLKERYRKSKGNLEEILQEI